MTQKWNQEARLDQRTSSRSEASNIKEGAGLTLPASLQLNASPSTHPVEASGFARRSSSELGQESRSDWRGLKPEPPLNDQDWILMALNVVVVPGLPLPLPRTSFSLLACVIAIQTAKVLILIMSVINAGPTIRGRRTGGGRDGWFVVMEGFYCL